MTFGILSDAPGTSTYHKDILRGIEAYGRSAGINVLTLAVGPYGSELPKERGRKVLYDILRGDACSGLIVYTASVGPIVGPDKLFSELAEIYDGPMVSLSVPQKGYPSVVIDNRPGFIDLCRHLIQDHGYHDIVFLSGHAENYDSKVRLGILRDVMEEAGLSLSEDRIWYGDYTAHSGSEAVRHFVGDTDRRPQAIICANDYAAIGAWEEAKKLGLILPGDMAVTGFDNIEISRFIEIPFTTVKQPFYQQGYTAAQLLHDALMGCRIPAVTEIPSKFVLRESCGCLPGDTVDKKTATDDDVSGFLNLYTPPLDEAFQRFLEDKPGDPLIRAWQVFINETRVKEFAEADILRYFNEISTRFSNRSIPQDKRTKLFKHLLRMQQIITDYYKETDVFGKVLHGGTLETMMEGIENYSQWLIGTQNIQSHSEELRDVFLSLDVKNAWLNLYTDPDHPFEKPLKSVFLMTGGVLKAQGVEGRDFPSLELIPKESSPLDWYSLLVEALYEGDDQLGLLLYDNLMWDSYTNDMLRMRLSSALQAVNITRHISETNESLQKEIRRRRESEAKLGSLMEELKNLSIKDELTGLFNRRGFLTIGERQIKHYVREKVDFLVLFADMDGLKKINDTWGHQEGDAAIRNAARILEASCRDADVVARLGGDEFTVLLGSAGPQHVELIKNRIEKNSTAMSAERGKNYRISLSLGFVAASDYPDAALRELLDYADRKLYEMKKNRKCK